jgi:hypothetical protein
MPDMTNRNAPVVLGMCALGWTALAVWRLEGADTVELPMQAAKAEILYPADRGIGVRAVLGKLIVRFPRPKMPCISLLGTLQSAIQRRPGRPFLRRSTTEQQ